MCECLEYDDGGMFLCEACAPMYQELRQAAEDARKYIGDDLYGEPTHLSAQQMYRKLSIALGYGQSTEASF